MGLSIYYSGKFNKNADLSELITEVKEIAETYFERIVNLINERNKKNKNPDF